MKFRNALALLLLVGGFSTGALAAEYELLKSQRETFDASRITAAQFETSAGKLKITGNPSATVIEVMADFRGRAGRGLTAEEILQGLELVMEVRGSTFYLKTDQRFRWNWGAGGLIDLELIVPARLALEIEDGSGSIDVSGIDSDVRIEDGSGSIRASRIGGNLTVRDGSGSIDVIEVGRDVEIVDGSGSIEVLRVSGSIRVRDGSGSIEVSDVGGSFEVTSDGSGGIRHTGVRGEVRIPNRKGRRWHEY